MRTQEDDKLTITLNVFDNEGNVVDTAPCELTIEQITDIIDHATQLALLSRDGEGTADVLAELEEALCASGVIDYRD